MKTASGILPESAETPCPSRLLSPGGAGGGNYSTGDAWGLVERAKGRGVMASRSSRDKNRHAASGPVLRTETTWSEYGQTLAEKRLALAALIARRNDGNRSHYLLSRIYLARTEIIAMENALA